MILDAPKCMRYKCLPKTSAAAAATTCATENAPDGGATCSCTGIVYYGADTRWNTVTSTGTVECNSGVFGDPAPGVHKACRCETVPEPLAKQSWCNSQAQYCERHPQTAGCTPTCTSRLEVVPSSSYRRLQQVTDICQDVQQQTPPQHLERSCNFFKRECTWGVATQLCCRERTSWCLACQEQMTEAQFCQSNPGIAGCADTCTTSNPMHYSEGSALLEAGLCTKLLGLEQCEAKARALGLSRAKADVMSDEWHPSGCVWYDGNHLVFNTAVNDYKCSPTGKCLCDNTCVLTPPPTAAPTAVPTVAPTAAPTTAPTAAPTASPTASPTSAPTAAPTTTPTTAPTPAPTPHPCDNGSHGCDSAFGICTKTDEPKAMRRRLRAAAAAAPTNSYTCSCAAGSWQSAAHDP